MIESRNQTGDIFSHGDVDTLAIIVTMRNIGMREGIGTQAIETMGAQIEVMTGSSLAVDIHDARWRAGFGTVMVGRWTRTQKIT